MAPVHEDRRTVTPAVSIVYLTHRTEPRFDWFCDSLAVEIGVDTPEVIFVDGLHSPGRAARSRSIPPSSSVSRSIRRMRSSPHA